MHDGCMRLCRQRIKLPDQSAWMMISKALYEQVHYFVHLWMFRTDGQVKFVLHFWTYFQMFLQANYQFTFGPVQAGTDNDEVIEQIGSLQECFGCKQRS